MADANQTNLPKGSKEIGESGTRIINGFITGEEYNADLRGRRMYEIYEEMRRGNATVKATLSAVKLPIASATWSVQPASDDATDLEAAALVEANLMEVLNFQSILSEALTHLDFGFAVFEKCWGVQEIDGKWRVVLNKLAFRKQTTLYKWETEDGKPGITQMNVAGKTFGIPASKLLVITNAQEGENYEGVSILRPAYQSWYIINQLYKIDAIGHERQALGVVDVQYPKGASEKDIRKVERLARNVRANEEAYISHPEGWNIGFMDMKAHTLKDIGPSVSHHNRQITLSAMAQWLMIGAENGSGTRSAGEDQSSMFELANQAVAENIAADFNAQVIKQIVDLNFNVKAYPKIVVSRVGRENLKEMADTFKTLVDAGGINPYEQDEEHLRKLMHLPLPKEIDGDNSTTNLSTGEKKPTHTEIEDVEKPGDKGGKVDASVSARDFPGLHEDLGVDPKNLGCIMVDAEPLAILDHVEDGAADLVTATDRHDHQMGAVAEVEPHVTLLFGLLENGNVWKEQVDTVLDGWKMDSIEIEEVDYFDTPDSYAVIAHVKKTPELIDGHERLTLLPHVATFSEYRPHLTLAYVDKSADVDKWVSALGKAYNGKKLKTKGINYGDLPEDRATKASALHAQAKRLSEQLTQELYGSRRAA